MADANLLKLPLDYQSSPTFRRMVELLEGGVVAASYVFVTFWTDLAYLAKDGGEVGVIRREDRPGFLRVLGLVAADAEALLGRLVEARFLHADGERLVCPRFIEANAHLRPGQTTRESTGGVMKHFYREVKRAEDAGFQQMILIAADKLVDKDGATLDADTIRRVKWLVKVCDSALGKPTRPAYLFSPDLIANATEVVRAMSNDECLAVCAYLAKNRSHPSLSGMVTEKLLPNFGGILRDMNGVE